MPVVRRSSFSFSASTNFSSLEPCLTKKWRVVKLGVAYRVPALSGAAMPQVDIEFSCTPFYIDAVRELEPYVDFYKIASYELLWDDLLVACARTGKRVVISTGMATMPEILHAVNVLKLNGSSAPVLLHCTSAYPTPHEEANLAAIETIRHATGCEVGWSDHTVEPASGQSCHQSMGCQSNRIPPRSRWTG